MPTIAGSRVRSNNAYGVTTNNPLLPGDTVLTSTQLILLPNIGVGQHAILVLDPKRITGEPEIVIVTAHTGLSTSATITRAAYGTIARSPNWPVGTAWAHITVADDYTQIVTSTTRPANPYAGQAIYETDTFTMRYFNGTVWNNDPPTGSIFAYGGSTAPTGYILANGVAQSRTGATAALFAVFSTNYGSGDGSTTFGIPDLRGKIPVGLDSGQAEFNTLNQTGGVKTVTLGAAEMPLHVHGITDPGHNHTQNAHGHVINISDPGHGHTLTDPGHAHGIDGNVPAGNRIVISHPLGVDRMNPAGGGTQTPITISHMDNNTTGITIAGGVGTGISSSSVGFTATNIANSTGITVTTGAGSGGAHQNLQPYITLNYIIKI